MNKYLAFLSAVVLMCQCADRFAINDYNMNCLPDVEDKYFYKVVPGTDAWKDLTSSEEMDKACLLPNDILKNISTP